MPLNAFYSASEKGFTLIEVVLAVTILAIGIMGYTNLKVSSLASRQYANEMTKSVLLSNGQLEQMLLEKFDSMSLNPGTHTLPEDLEIDGFAVAGTFTVRDQCPNENSKMITFTGTWNQEGSPRSITLTQVRVQR